MFDRAVLKERARTVLKGSYWISFVVALFMPVVSWGGVGFDFGANLSDNASVQPTYPYEAESFYNDIFPILMNIMFVVFALAMVVAIGLSIFVFSPLRVGGKRFFIRAGGGHEVKFSNLGYCFKNGYWNVVKTMFMKNLFIFLWSLIALIPFVILLGIFSAAFLMQSAYTGADLTAYNGYIRELLGFTATGDQSIAIILLIVVPLLFFVASIPACIAQYRYWMVEYILAEDPYMPWRAVLQKSKDLMYRNKWDTFKLDLSFLGWIWLGLVACGIGVLFVQPYMEATYAQLYLYVTNRFHTEPATEYIPYNE